MLTDSLFGFATIHHRTATKMVNAAFRKNPKFHVYFTLEGWMLTNATAGLAPVTTMVDAISQVALAGIFRLIGLFVLNDWWHTIRTFPKSSTEKTKDE